jgi:hypothetical protein
MPHRCLLPTAVTPSGEYSGGSQCLVCESLRCGELTDAVCGEDPQDGALTSSLDPADWLPEEGGQGLNARPGVRSAWPENTW